MSEKIVNPVVQGLNEAKRAAHQNMNHNQSHEQILMNCVSKLADTNQLLERNVKVVEVQDARFSKMLMMKMGYGHDFVRIFETEVIGSVEDGITQSIIHLLELAGTLDINIEQHLNARLAYNETKKRLKRRP